MLPKPAYPDPAYPDIGNLALLDRMPLSARVVLDVGCHTGALGAAYKARNPRARVLGIETDPHAAAIAATRLDAVAPVDLESDPLPFDLADGLDCIVYGDVLEHLRDPWAVLARQMTALNRDGTILICVPNIEHWRFAARLLRGDWDYEASGLFDASHLRWFTSRSMRAGLERLGLTVCDVTPRIFERAAAQAFLDAIAPSLQTLGIDAGEYATRALPLQYIWRAQREARPVLHVAATMLAPVGGVSDVRVVYPQRAIATDPTVVTSISATKDFPELSPDTPKICVLHRPVLNGVPGLATLKKLLEKNWVVVTEFDDHPDHFPAMRVTEQYSFSGVHAVQTSTEPLAKILRARNPSVAVFPNAMRALPEPRNFSDLQNLTLFFGALNRQADWAELLPTLNQVAAVTGKRLKFRIVHDQALFAALATPHKEFFPTCDHDTYLDLLGASEIAFMPLADTAFNRAKSDLKFIEAAACRATPLASPVVYAGSVADGRTGVIFRSAEELRTRLLQLVTFPEMARDIADAARAHVAASRMLAYQVEARIAWYRALWERREELTAALLARVPELRTAVAG